MVNKTRRTTLLACVLCLLLGMLALVQPVYAQDYRFTLPQYEVEAYIEADGTVTLYYYMVFDNAPGAHIIDFIDLGLPNRQVNLNRIEADINDKPISGVKSSQYVSGAAELALGSNAIPAGQSGTVRVYIRQIGGMLFDYDNPDREGYVNFQFTPNYFSSQFERSRNTKYRMTIILPPGVGSQDGVYYEPSGWPGSDTPEASLTTDNRVFYSWYTEDANVHTNYLFGAAFPASAVPATAISSGTAGSGSTGGSGGGSFAGLLNSLRSFLPCLIFAGISVIAVIRSALKRNQNTVARRMQYMPPKISIEGQGIKRGLTAVEAGLLLELPIDRVLTMILFGLLKKEAVTISSQDPLEFNASNPLPAGLYDYETAFIDAYKAKETGERRRLLKSLMIDLVKSVSDKMKGFSKAETVAYYKDIVNRAWAAVEGAKTPEVKSAQYNENLEWTMMDEDFSGRTDRTFTGQPVFIPRWWPRYDPVYRQGMGSGPLASPARPSGLPSAGSKPGTPSMSLPNIPGSDFAAKMINGASTMAASTIGNIETFTSGVTRMTNPIPLEPARSSSGSGGFRGSGGSGCVSCACACACAGCACACAGGGR